MTLVSVEKPDGKPLTLSGDLAKKYAALERRLGPSLAPIKENLNGMIDGTRIQTSSWMPGSNWQGGPFQAIYDACAKDEEEAGKSFGLIVWKVFEERPETWTSARGMKDGREIRGRTYFRWPNPEE
jgi:hypothetical protein